MLYTRLNDSGQAFEPQRNVLLFAEGLDGGGSVAANNLGNVPYRPRFQFYVARACSPALPDPPR
jgi:hypothetical protein